MVCCNVINELVLLTRLSLSLIFTENSIYSDTHLEKYLFILVGNNMDQNLEFHFFEEDGLQVECLFLDSSIPMVHRLWGH
jgi:hypothetical protein